MERNKQWYIVYTNAESEFIILHALKKKGIECFCPLTVSAVNARHKKVDKPLLPNYVFVRLLPEEHSVVRRVKGILNFMYWLNKLITVSDEDIFTLKDLTENYHVLLSEKIKVIAGQSAFRVQQSAAVTISINSNNEDNDFVKTLFPAYGFAITAKESKMNVRVIETDAYKSRKATAKLQFNSQH